MEIQPGEICANAKVAHTHTLTHYTQTKKMKKKTKSGSPNAKQTSEWRQNDTDSVAKVSNRANHSMYTLSISTLDENESTKHWDSSSAAYFASVFFFFFFFCYKDRYFGALVLADKPKTIPILFTLAVCIMFCLIQRRGHTLCAIALRLSPIEEFRESIYWNGHRWRALDKNTFVSLLSARRSTTVPLFSHKPHGQWPNSWRESDLRHCVRWHTYDPVIPFTSKSEKIHYQSISNVLVVYKHTHTRIYSISIQNELFWSE